MLLNEIHNKPLNIVFRGILTVYNSGGERDTASADVELEGGRTLHYARAPKEFLAVAGVGRRVKIMFNAKTQGGMLPYNVVVLDK